MRRVEIRQSEEMENEELMLAVIAFLLWAGNPEFSTEKINYYAQSLIEHEMEGFNDEEIH